MDIYKKADNQQAKTLLSKNIIRRGGLPAKQVDDAFDRMKERLEKIYAGKRITLYPE